MAMNPLLSPPRRLNAAATIAVNDDGLILH
jgi:hypothetical protein